MMIMTCLVARRASNFLGDSSRIRLVCCGLLTVFSSVGLVLSSARARVVFLRLTKRMSLSEDLSFLLFGYGAVYRMHACLAFFFFLSGLSTIGVKSDVSFRSRLYNNYWYLKIPLVISLTVLSLCIPKTSYTGEIWHFFGLNGGFIFEPILFTFILYLSGQLFRGLDPNNRRISGYCVMAGSILILFCLVLLYWLYRHYYVGTLCKKNLVFIAVQFYLVVALMLISLHPAVRPLTMPHTFCRTSFVCAYNTFLMVNTFLTEPSSECNPMYKHVIETDTLQNVRVIASLILTHFILMAMALTSFKAPIFGSDRPAEPDEIKVKSSSTDRLYFEDYAYCLSLKMNTGTIRLEGLKQSTQAARDTILNPTAGDPSLASPDETSGEVLEGPQTPKKLAESETSADLSSENDHSYTFFNMVWCLAALYNMMTLTNWYRSEESPVWTSKLVAGWGSMWIRLCAVMLCSVVYVWSLVAPLLFPADYRRIAFYSYFFDDLR